MAKREPNKDKQKKLLAFLKQEIKKKKEKEDEKKNKSE